MDDGFNSRFLDDNEEGEEREPEEYGNHDGVLLKVAAQYMPENTLESFLYDSFFESEDVFRSRLMSFLFPQFQALKEVHLGNTRSLSGFSALESLVIYGMTYEFEQNNFGIALMHVDVAAMSFGGFLANVGKQKDLRVLDLRVAVPPNIYHADEQPWTYRNEIFPGLLTLNGTTLNRHTHGGLRRRRGFLDMLSGLSKLEELRGSVSLNPRDSYGYRTGRLEAEWMKVHWPRLKVAEFYPRTEVYETPLVAAEWLWLQKQLPGLIYDDDHSA
ncbi:hypothetical protein BGW39_002275 [Mortierella sp. 14UC]|nr:hypothetical protein BGW39_002275 [Mortierella sp. 14UC]